jgi:hypothetical protein
MPSRFGMTSFLLDMWSRSIDRDYGISKNCYRVPFRRADDHDDPKVMTPMTTDQNPEARYKVGRERFL